MFTGIITAVGRVRAATRAAGELDMRIEIEVPAGFVASQGGTALGASIACSGVCLTAVAVEEAAFAVEVSAETAARSTLGSWVVGTRINLERSLRLGDELGGHLVSGHVDGLGRVVAIDQVGGSWRLVVRVAAALGPFVAEKGSVALDGVSLTVNRVADGADGTEIEVNVIAHTAAATTLGELVAGDAVHVEVDMLARYVARQGQASGVVLAPHQRPGS